MIHDDRTDETNVQYDNRTTVFKTIRACQKVCHLMPTILRQPEMGRHRDRHSSNKDLPSSQKTRKPVAQKRYLENNRRLNPQGSVVLP